VGYFLPVNLVRVTRSTESLILRLLSDIYGVIDRTRVTLLTLYDVSAAFDSVDQDFPQSSLLNV
jgi:hypothetical protein